MLYHRILIALDGDAEEKAVIDEAVRVATALEANLEVIHVNDPTAGKASMMMDTLPLVTEEDLRDLIKRSGYEGIAKRINIQIAVSEDYPSEIAKATRNADLLILGHHQKNVVQAFLTDGTDERVADMVDCPVLMIPMP